MQALSRINGIFRFLIHRVPAHTQALGRLCEEGEIGPNGSIWYYNYDPANPDAAQKGDLKGYVSNGEGNKTLDEVVVRGTHQNKNSGNSQNQALQTVSSSGRTWDPVTDRRINQLDERVRDPAFRFINRVNNELGVHLRVAQGLRTIQEQDNLYAQGRTRRGQIVTNARGGQSYHNFGLAVDVYVVVNGRVDLNQVVPPEVVEIARQEGFEWGGVIGGDSEIIHTFK